MNDQYVIQHLVKHAELFYGNEGKCFAYRKKDYYIFGSKKLKIKNKVSRHLALYLSTYKHPIMRKKEIKYQITFLNLETMRTELYCSGACFYLDEIKEQIKLLKQEQQQLELEHHLPRTKSKFKKKKVIIYD